MVRSFLLVLGLMEWNSSLNLSNSAGAQSRVLIVPDKDADGLSSGVIIYRTLTKLGLAPSLIDVHLVQKGANIHDDTERAAMQAKQPKYVIVVDQGSKAAPPVVDSVETKSLIIDHHMADEFPKDALVLESPLVVDGTGTDNTLARL